MFVPAAQKRSTFWLVTFLTLFVAGATGARAQTPVKKIRVAIPAANVTYLPFYVAKANRYYRDEGFDVEFILMPAAIASTAVLTGDIDYNGAVTGVIGAAVKGEPIKAVIFTMRSPVQGLMAKTDVKAIPQLKGRTIGVSSPGSTTDLATRYILKRQGLEAGRDYSVTYLATEAGRLAALSSGVIDAAMLSVPENILARQKGFNEIAFSGDFIQFPQNGFGTSNKKIKENPDEVHRMVRATLRGLIFVSDKKNRDASIGTIMKNWAVKSPAMAGEMYDYMARVMLSDGSINMVGLQALVDQQRESAKVKEPVNAAQVIDYSFVETARKELGLLK